MPPANEPAQADGTVLLRNAATGYTVAVPRSATRADRVADLRRRLRLADLTASSTTEDNLRVDPATNTYSFNRYPPLAFMVNAKWFIAFGALLIAACSQLSFLFPCSIGYSAVEWRGASYCVPADRVADVTPTACPQDICSKRIPVTLQTYAVLLNGALAGTTGVWSTVLYVVLVCLGAPFGSNRKVDPVWNKGAIVGASGGYFWGFILATLIMARCSAKGHDRPRRFYWMLPWMLAAEGAIYACGLFWMPFGMAIVRGVSPAAICPAEAGAGPCLKNIFNWGMVPFLPGEVAKMILVWVTVPVAWWALLAWHRWRHGAALAAAAAPEESSNSDEEEGGAGETVQRSIELVGRVPSAHKPSSPAAAAAASFAASSASALSAASPSVAEPEGVKLSV